MRHMVLASPAPAQVERRSRRRRRLPALGVELERHGYRSDDWSLIGFRLTGLHRAVAPGERVSGLVRDPSGSISGAVVAEVAWTDGDRAGFRFLSVAPRLYRGLQPFAGR